MRLPRSPTLETLAVMLVVFLVQQLVALVSYGAAIGLFALAYPIELRPWTLLTSVYAHADLGHLIANAVGLAIFGFPLERLTTRWRFHAFFVLTGALAGAFQVTVTALAPTGPPTAVLGASGAVFALIGYVLTSNSVAGGLFEHLELGIVGQVLLFAVVAALITVATGGEGVAHAAHFFGFLLGLVAGRANLLRVRREPRAPPAPGY